MLRLRQPYSYLLYSLIHTMIQDWLLLQMNIEAVSLPLFVEVTAISTLIDALPKK